MRRSDGTQGWNPMLRLSSCRMIGLELCNNYFLESAGSLLKPRNLEPSPHSGTQQINGGTWGSPNTGSGHQRASKTEHTAFEKWNVYLRYNTKHGERSNFEIPKIYNPHTSLHVYYCWQPTKMREQIQRAFKGKQESNRIRGRDEVKWILLCLQGQSNNSSSHGSWRRCPCVTVCAAVSQVRCDLKTEEPKVTDAGNKGWAGMQEETRKVGVWDTGKNGDGSTKQSERGKMNEQKGFGDHKDLDTPEARITALTHCQNADKRHTHSQAGTQVTDYSKNSGNHLHKAYKTGPVRCLCSILHGLCTVS